MRYISCVIIFLFFLTNNPVVFSNQKSIYEQALNNIKIEYATLKDKYTKEVISELDKTNYSTKKYASRLNLFYKGIEEAEIILQNKITAINHEIENDSGYKGIVFLDPGHGGNDTGATVPPYLGDRVQLDLAESDITFAIAKIVEENLVNQGYMVILSRDLITDGPSLYARSALCGAINPDVSISIHLNSTEYAYPVFDVPETAMPEINYARVYVWAPAPDDLLLPFYLDTHNKIISSNSRKLSLELARITALSLKKYLDVDFYMPDEKLIALAEVKSLRRELQNKNTLASSKIQYDKVSESIVPAEVSELNKKICAEYSEGIKNISGVEGKDLHMVREIPAIPSILVEPVFISNPEEQYKLKKLDRIQRIAEAIEKAVIEYFENKNN